MAGAGWRAGFLPEFFPIPEAGGDVDWQRESELMREHAYLPAMMGFVSQHVAQHFRANRPRRAPAVSAKFFNAAAIAKRFCEHLLATGGAFRQRRAGLLPRAARTVELWRNFQVRSGEPDPLGADVVHVGENCRDAANLA